MTIRVVGVRVTAEYSLNAFVAARAFDVALAAFVHKVGVLATDVGAVGEGKLSPPHPEIVPSTTHSTVRNTKDHRHDITLNMHA